MTIIHPLSFPIMQFETATSYASRLTRYCGLQYPSDLCLDLGLRWQDFVRGDDNLCRQLAFIGGVDPDVLARHAIRTIAKGRYSILGHVCSRGSLLRTRVRVCPVCLQKDVREFGNDGVFRRYYWQLASIRTCALHATPLIALPVAKYTIENYDFVGQVTKHWELLQGILPGRCFRQSTAFENYLDKRLVGERQHQFLDRLSLHTATRLCETLGYVLEFGHTAKLSEANDSEMSRAGQTGFAVLECGEEGLLDALHNLRSNDWLKTMRHKTDFGAFYEWLRVSPFHDDVEPIRRIVRNYVFEHYPVPTGFEVLGHPCPQRSVYTIEAACKSLGVRRKRMNRYLLSNGAAQKENAHDSIFLTQQLSQSDIDQLSAKMAGRIKMPEALKVLQVGVKTLLDLCDVGLIDQKLDSLDQLPKYQRSELLDLLDLLAKKLTTSRVDRVKLVPLTWIAKQLKCRSAEIVMMVLEDKLTHVFGDVRNDGINGLRLNVDEVRNAIPCLKMPGITRSVASTTLRVTYQTINYLVEKGLLKSARMRNPKSRQFLNGICDGSIDRFLSKYDTLGLMAKRYRRMPGPLGCHLEAKGICPLEAPKGISWIYEKRGLSARIKRLGIERHIQPEGG